MGTGSLLDIENARKRLEELDQEAEGLSDLIRKLRQIRETMTSLQEDTLKNKTDTENWLKSVENYYSGLTTKTAEVMRSIPQTLDSFNRKAEILLNETSTKANHILRQNEQNIVVASESINKMNTELRETIAEKLKIIEKNLETFKDKHMERLDQVSKSYERIRISYDTIRDAIKSIESLFDSIQVKFNDRVNQINKTVEKIRQQFTSDQEALRRSIDNEIIGNSELMQKKWDEKASLFDSQINTLKREMDERAAYHKRTMRFLWLAVILGLLLGGFSIAILLFHRF